MENLSSEQVESRQKLESQTTSDTYAVTIRTILARSGLTAGQLAQYLGTSLVSVVRWERGDTQPGSKMRGKIADAQARLDKEGELNLRNVISSHLFASRGARGASDADSIAKDLKTPKLEHKPKQPILQRLRKGDLWGDGPAVLMNLLADHGCASQTIEKPAAEGVSAGKNTYTYDAHTYHTKVPPQGIAEVIRKYLPMGGLVLDPFAGSGMTGVAARAVGADVILNELSPAASFISDRFTRSYDPATFIAGIKAICNSLADLRRELYTTRCRTCDKDTEILFTVWSYKVRCSACDHEFVLWDHCRYYGKTVREHKILSEFTCPQCATTIKKSRLQRTKAVPVFLGYKCCSTTQVEHPLTANDRALLKRLEVTPLLAHGFVPTTNLPDGVNLCQPKRHGFTSVDRFYTPRNLSAMSQLWRAIHCVTDPELAGFLCFVFTSLYQRVTKLSEYRFWGGSGNTARFNVPYIFNEANVFVTFERKARTILDHLETTARSYSGRAVVRTGSATNLSFLPNNSIDLVFTDPPFGANINYSEMNILWESWFGHFTDNTDEAIVNRFQNKDVARYGQLMADSLKEAYRVLRPGHWMILVFMNSAESVWMALQNAVREAGFTLERVDIFDKQHGTFKQFVSDNTAGCDLLLHCRKADVNEHHTLPKVTNNTAEDIGDFLSNRLKTIPKLPYLHVQRAEEIDYRMLYSEFLADRLIYNGNLVGFVDFRRITASLLAQNLGESK